MPGKPLRCTLAYRQVQHDIYGTRKQQNYLVITFYFLFSFQLILDQIRKCKNLKKKIFPAVIHYWYEYLRSKELIHNAVKIDSFGIFERVFIITNLAPPKNHSGAVASLSFL